jgi:hypothetical protein
MSSKILTSTYRPYGNDGNHFNDSINHLPNAAVPDSIANALHNASDHLPVSARFVFPRNVVPIQLAYLRAVLNSQRDSVVVKWMTVSETNNFGFEVQRRVDTTLQFETIPNSFVPGNGTTLEPHNYSFAESIPTQGNLQYRLKQIDLDGEVHFTEPVYVQILSNVPLTSVVEHYSLLQNYPNPFNPSTTITFSLASSATASIEVYDILGQQVSVLYSKLADAGEHAVQFDGRDTKGNALSSGIYFYRLVLQSDGATMLASRMNRMILLR